MVVGRWPSSPTRACVDRLRACVDPAERTEVWLCLASSSSRVVTASASDCARHSDLRNDDEARKRRRRRGPRRTDTRPTVPRQPGEARVGEYAHARCVWSWLRCLRSRLSPAATRSDAVRLLRPHTPAAPPPLPSAHLHPTPLQPATSPPRDSSLACPPPTWRSSSPSNGPCSRPRQSPAGRRRRACCWALGAEWTTDRRQATELQQNGRSMLV